MNTIGTPDRKISTLRLQKVLKKLDDSEEVRNLLIPWIYRTPRKFGRFFSYYDELRLKAK